MKIREIRAVGLYGATPEEATRKAKSLALRVIAEEIEHGEMTPAADMLQFYRTSRLFRSMFGSARALGPGDIIKIAGGYRSATTEQLLALTMRMVSSMRTKI